MARPIPNLSAVEVVRAELVSPSMRRVTMTGEDLARFDRADHLHVSLLLPQRPGHRFTWPRFKPGAADIVEWGPPEDRPFLRTYTVRHVDAEAGLLTIDFALHDDPGPGTRWGATVRPGDTAAIWGPGGRSHRPGGWNLLVGDETALPAIGRILETAPASMAGRAIVEVASAEDELPLAAGPDFELTYVHRGRKKPGTSQALAQAVEAIEWPETGDVRAWCGAEFSAFRRIRADWRKGRGLPRDRHLAVAYWRRGICDQRGK